MQHILFQFTLTLGLSSMSNSSPTLYGKPFFSTPATSGMMTFRVLFYVFFSFVSGWAREKNWKGSDRVACRNLYCSRTSNRLTDCGFIALYRLQHSNRFNEVFETDAFWEWFLSYWGCRLLQKFLITELSPPDRKHMKHKSRHRV